MSKEAFLVIGATGQVGSAAVQALAARGHVVKAAARGAPQASFASGVESVAFDFREPASYAAALQGVAGAFVMAPPGVLDAYALVAPFLHAAAAKGVRIVLMTSMGVDASEDIPLRRLERVVERSGQPYAIVRPNWFMQNFHTYWMPGIAATSALAVPAADSRTAFVDARDVGEAAAVLLAAPRPEHARAHILTGPESLSYAEAAATLSQQTGRPIRYQAADDESFRSSMVSAGLPADYVGFLIAIFAAVRAGLNAEVTSDLPSLLGRAPRELATYAADHRWAFASP